MGTQLQMQAGLAGCHQTHNVLVALLTENLRQMGNTQMMDTPDPRHKNAVYQCLSLLCTKTHLGTAHCIADHLPRWSTRSAQLDKATLYHSNRKLPCHTLLYQCELWC